ncbi:MAG TPA: bifunctional phosphoribosylaminoimidazolecarboxamide formyltransferase/inosine monophosphate cyclohydrolase [Candidatus Omnitrophica bacterium]|nr:MAG: bifunctional phosphoribosylaminoimidazolecarboxamide formyltransferase/IMP cyclohydrolase [Omnitrophica WOR_2 bacterium GWA2_45_18]OGX20731.1 MAG: bifunctional phosphoribosylaminoimidazolecarboxamide formyltransferase/IMP cyclohydrolase [Omnitrophica WOR_2 bacterium GWC2_45_7]HBR15268.1 bifunctional phosphoribosylaminoimidazolecarboxamide formyltransferase/inosine monophosphate cyclohydrolase [Candidatus Omnitrophota bacterium]
MKVKRALVSVSDKKGLLAFAKGLQALGIEILSTGGTASQLKEAGIPVIEVSEYTGFPEMLDGRVKTLHPKIHGGLLALREKPEHMDQLRKYNIGLIDMAVVNLYPFESVIKKVNVSLEEAIENIDIGGPSMLRSAAKNFKNVAVVCNPARYEEILKELDVNSGLLSDSVLFHLAVEAFSHTAQYDTIISEFLNNRLRGQGFALLPQELRLKFTKIQDLRYGENPHQQAAFYKEAGQQDYGLAQMKQLHGKELSFNNILDLNAAVDFVKDFQSPAAVIIKHNNPTGVAEDSALAKAYKQAWQADPVSAFGGVIGFNQRVDLPTAQLISQSGFMECIIAPAFAPETVKVLSQKKNLRLIELDFKYLRNKGCDFKKVHGGLLFQEKDERLLLEEDLKCVTQKKPTKSQLEAMRFGWKVVKNIRSNAIVLVKGTKTVGIGAGQTSRVESVRIAIQKAGKNAVNAVLVSDAFIPMMDNVQLAAKAGIKAIIQTGGSMADAEVIKAADKARIAMVMTGVRHFKH